MPFPPCGPPEAPLPALVFASPSVGHESRNVLQSSVNRNHRVTVKTEDSCDDMGGKFDRVTSDQSSDAKQIKAKQEKGKGEKDQSRNPFLVILTAEQARSIYSLRSASTAEGPQAHLVAGKSSLVAEMYGVSPKTIRDVWNRKTWTQVTRSLWSEEEADLYSREHMTPEQRAALGDTEQLLKRRGRPPGSKDARPRKRRLQIVEEVIEQHALQNGAEAFLDDISSAPPPAQRPDSPVCAPPVAMDDEVPELHGPCDRFAAPPPSSDQVDKEPLPDHPDRRVSPDHGRWAEAEEEAAHGEVSGPPAEEDEEPASLDADPCGDAPSSGYGRSWLHDEDHGWSGKFHLGASAVAAAGLFPDDDDWFPGAPVPGEVAACAPAAWDDGRHAVGGWGVDHAAAGCHGLASSAGCHGLASSAGCHGLASSAGCHGLTSSAGCHGLTSSAGCHGLSSAPARGHGLSSAPPGCHGLSASAGCHGGAERERGHGSWGLEPLGRHWGGGGGGGGASCGLAEDDSAGAWYMAYGQDHHRSRGGFDFGRAPAAGWCAAGAGGGGVGGGGGGGEYVAWGMGGRLDHV